MASVTAVQAFTAIAAVASVASAVQQRKASKAQRKQNKVSNRIAAINRQRSIKRAIASRRIAVAEAQSVGFSLGVGGGTAVQGAAQGIVGDAANAIGASNLNFTGQQAIASLSDRISSLNQSANTFASIGSVASIFTNQQNVEAVGGLFGAED